MNMYIYIYIHTNINVKSWGIPPLVSLVPLVYQAAEAQASAQALQPAAAAAPVEDNRPWQDFRYATLEEVKAELVRARGQVFKIQHDT